MPTTTSSGSPPTAPARTARRIRQAGVDHDAEVEDREHQYAGRRERVPSSINNCPAWRRRSRPRAGRIGVAISATSRESRLVMIQRHETMTIPEARLSARSSHVHSRAPRPIVKAPAGAALSKPAMNRLRARAKSRQRCCHQLTLRRSKGPWDPRPQARATSPRRFRGSRVMHPAGRYAPPDSCPSGSARRWRQDRAPRRGSNRGRFRASRYTSRPGPSAIGRSRPTCMSSMPASRSVAAVELVAQRRRSRCAGRATSCPLAQHSRYSRKRCAFCAFRRPSAAHDDCASPPAWSCG